MSEKKSERDRHKDEPKKNAWTKQNALYDGEYAVHDNIHTQLLSLSWCNLDISMEM